MEIFPQERASGIDSRLHPHKSTPSTTVDALNVSLATSSRKMIIRSSLIFQNAKLLQLATPFSRSALAALAVESVFGALLLRRRIEQQAAVAQPLLMVELDVGFVLVHFAQDDDVGWVALLTLC